MERHEVLSCLRTILNARLPLPDQSDAVIEGVGLLGQGIGLDSIEVVELVTAAEAALGITVAEGDLLPEHFLTVGTFVTFLQERVP